MAQNTSEAGRSRGMGQLPSLETRAPGLPAIEEGAAVAKLAPLPEMKKLPIGESADAEADHPAASAPGHGGSGPGVDGNVSARTYFREQRERMLMRGKEVRLVESAEIAYLASCRLRNHFTRELAEAKNAELAKKKVEKKGRKPQAPESDSAANDATVDEQTSWPPRDLQFKWLEAALEGHSTEGRISNDSLSAMLNKVGLRLGDEQVRLFVEWLSYPETEVEEDPVVHDIFYGREDAIETARARAIAAAEVAAAAEAEAAKAAAEAAEAAARADAAAEAERTRRANAHLANPDLLLELDSSGAAGAAAGQDTEVGGEDVTDEGEASQGAREGERGHEAEAERQKRLRQEKTAHMRRRFKFDDPLAGQKKTVAQEAEEEEELGPVFAAVEDFVRKFTKFKVFVAGSNEWGQLALHDTTCLITPKPLVVGGEVDAVAAGGAQTWLATRRALPSLGADGKVSVSAVNEILVAGRNEHGQLGLGHAQSVLALTPVASLTGAKVQSVALGAFHTLVLLDGGDVLGCGWNRWGQLGLGDTEDRHELARVSSLQDKSVTRIACGAGFSAVLCANFKVYSWGSNLAGQLGLGFLGGGRFPHFHEEGAPPCMTQPQSSPEASQASESRGAHGSSPPSYCSTPTMVPGVMAVRGKALVCGGLHTIVLGAAGVLLAWGGNHEGQAGVGRLDPSVPSPEKIYSVIQVDGPREPAKKSAAASAVAKPKVASLEPKGPAAVQVSCGYSHTVMLTDEGQVYSCGASTYGQLGTSGSESVLRLKKLDAIGFGSDQAGPTKGQEVVDIIAGDFHTAVRIQDGSWWSWGRNNRGQLAVGTLDASSQPQRVPRMLLFPPTGGANLSSGAAIKEEEPQEPRIIVAGGLHSIVVADRIGAYP